MDTSSEPTILPLSLYKIPPGAKEDVDRWRKHGLTSLSRQLDHSHRLRYAHAAEVYEGNWSSDLLRNSLTTTSSHGNYYVDNYDDDLLSN